MSTYDIAVIGIGMIGSAALRYLSAAGFNCIGIGPGEPDEWSAHAGAFSSHYDSFLSARQGAQCALYG